MSLAVRACQQNERSRMSDPAIANRLRRLPRTVTLGLGALAMTALAGCVAAPGNGAVSIDEDDIGGVVTGSSGPEAGVWVIAHTGDLPTPFTRIVVTDDEGRYLLPDL